MPIIEYVIAGKIVKVIFPGSLRKAAVGDDVPDGYVPVTAYYVKHTDQNIRCMVKCRYCEKRVKKDTVYRCALLPRKNLTIEWKFCDHFVVSGNIAKAIQKEKDFRGQLPYDGGWLDKAMLSRV